MFDILVIDDNENTRKLLGAILENEGYHVHFAEDGIIGLEVLDNHHIDLAIVDIMMPNMNGYEFTKELRDVENELPILMLTAKQLPSDRKIGYALGTDDYMTKPIDEEEFLIRIKGLLKRAQIVHERKLQIGKLTLYYDTYTMEYQGNVQILPQKEFLLLYKLLSYPDKIFTRIQLMDEIWGVESDAGWETITVHINRLRKRLTDCNEIELVCIRGLGYKAVKK